MSHKTSSKSYKASLLVPQLALLVLAALLSPVLYKTPAQAEDNRSVTVLRIQGTDRVSTAIEASKRFFTPGTVDEVVLVTGSNYPDALAAGPLARYLRSPILLTSSQHLSNGLLEEIDRLGASRVTVVGGTQAISESVVSALRSAGLTVSRISGADRYATAAAVTNRFIRSNDEITLALGDASPTVTDGFADAVSSASLGMRGTRVGTVLAAPNGIPEATSELVADVSPGRATAVGGTASISATTYGQLSSLVGNSRRLSGSNRYATSAVVARAAQVGGEAPTTVLIASGQTFPDALAAGALTGELTAPLLLVPKSLTAGSDLGRNRLANQVPEVAQYLADHAESIERIVIFGGTAAISTEISSAIQDLVHEAKPSDGASNDGGGGGGGGTPPSSSTSTSTTSSTSSTTSTTSSTTTTTAPPTTSTTVPVDPPEPPAPGGFAALLGQPVAGQVTAPIDTARAWIGGNGQVGVAEPSPISPERAAMASGRVLDRNGDGLVGVRVQVAGHPEYGYSETKEEGEYLLAFNGGGQVVLEYSLTGYLPSQRRVDFAWGDWLVMPDVVLIPRDAVSTVITLATGGVHEGTPVTDDDGTRTGRIYVQPGTNATMRFANGTTQPLTPSMTLRVTEYTVGPLGQEAMPGDLPPSIGYTYAAEVSVDEADAAGAVQIDLSKPASMYLDNFLDFAVGTRVPLGLYEQGPAAWIPSPDGVVMKVISVGGNGAAQLDIDGSGNAASGAELAELGIDLDEQKAIASTFNVDEVFWRVQLPHFSTPDLNYPIRPRDDVPEPPVPDPVIVDPTQPSNNEPSNTGFGQLRLESQAMVESLPIVGTPYSLVHSSDRVRGYEANIEVPIWSEPTPPTDPDFIEAVVQLQVAGRIIQSATLSKSDLNGNDNVTLAWDGRDRYGRQLTGSQGATIEVIHRYYGYYVVPSSTASASFGVPPSGQDIARSDDTTLISSRRPVDVVSKARVVISGPAWSSEALGLGGWGISALDGYDANLSRVLQGDGSTRTAPAIGGTYTLIAGNNSADQTCEAATHPCGDNGPAVSAMLDEVVTIESGPDGSIYVADFNGRRVRRIGPDGNIYAFAGSGAEDAADCVLNGTTTFRGGACGDGNLAINATLQASDLAVDRDGNVYIGDILTNRVRRVGTDGKISTVVGVNTGDTCSYDAEGNEVCGDGGPATAATLGMFTGNNMCWSSRRLLVDVGPDNSLWVEHGDRNRIRRVGSDGVIETVYTTGQVPCRPRILEASYRNPMEQGTLVRAVYQPEDAKIVPLGLEIPSETVYINDLLVKPDGTLVIASFDPDSSIQCMAITALNPGGDLKTITRPLGPDDSGDCYTESAEDDGKPALGKAVRATRLAQAPDGKLIVSTEDPGIWGLNNQLRSITPDGILSTVIPGSTTYGTPEPGDSVWNSPAVERIRGGIKIATVLPDGSIVVAFPEWWSGSNYEPARIMAVSSPLPGFSESEIVVAQPDGNAIEVFNNRGRHIRTESTLTGETLISFEYLSDGTLDKIIDANGHETVINRDGDGNAVSITGPFGHVTQLSLDSNGWLAEVQEPNGATTTINANDGGQVTEVTGALAGSTYAFTYSPSGRLTQAESPVGITTLSQSRTADTTTFNANSPEGNIQIEVKVLPGGRRQRTMTDPTGATAITVENADGTVTTTATDGTVITTMPGLDPRFGAGAAYIAKSVTTAPGGPTMTVTSSREVELDEGGSLVTLTETTTVNDKVSTTVYNSGTKTFTTTAPGGQVSTVTIDAQGRTVGTTASDQEPVAYVRDGFGRVVSTTFGTGPAARTTSRTFDDDTGHLKSDTNADGETTTYLTDANGRIIRITRPDGSIVNQNLGSAGHLLSLTTPTANEYSQTFNASGQITGFTVPAISGGPAAATMDRAYNLNGLLSGLTRPGEVPTTFTYYANGMYRGREGDAVLNHSYAYNGNQQLSGTSTADAATSYGWKGSLLTSEASSVAGSLLGSVTRTYDNEFRVASEKIGSVTLTNSYDINGLLEGVTGETIVRDAAGRITNRTVGATTVSYGYNAYGELNSIEAKHNGEVIYSEAITRDALGRVTARSEQIGTASNGSNPATLSTTNWTYTYDENGRLASANDGSGPRIFTYDANGNRISQGGGYNERDQVTGFDGKTYTFNNAGDLTEVTSEVDTTNFTYDAAGLLRAVTAGGSTTTYLHDGFDRRVGVDGGARWLYDVYGRIVAQYNSSNTQTSRLVYGASLHTPDFMIVGGENQIVISDWRGSPRLVVGADGTIKQRLDYDEWGAITNDTAPGYQPLGFRAGLVEQTTGLVRFGARDYDPTTGRFTTMDPATFAGGQTNLYVFGNNDPINRADPTGRGPSTGDGTPTPPPTVPTKPRTHGIGITGGGTVGIFSVGATAGIAWDGERPAIQIGGSLGGGSGLEAGLQGYYSNSSGGITGGLSAAASVGGAGGGGYGGGYDYSWDNEGNTGHTVTAGVVVGAEAHAATGVTLTVTIPKVVPQPGAYAEVQNAYASEYGRPRW